jgi:hypothetical protein
VSGRGYAPPSVAGPVIPPPPPQQGTRRSRGGTGDGRALSWTIALAVGVGAGIACYQLLPVVYESVDDWVASALG